MAEQWAPSPGVRHILTTKNVFMIKMTFFVLLELGDKSDSVLNNWVVNHCCYIYLLSLLSLLSEEVFVRMICAMLVKVLKKLHKVIKNTTVIENLVPYQKKRTGGHSCGCTYFKSKCTHKDVPEASIWPRGHLCGWICSHSRCTQDNVSLLTNQRMGRQKNPDMSQVAEELTVVALSITKFENAQYSCDFLEVSQEGKVVTCSSAWPLCVITMPKC